MKRTTIKRRTLINVLLISTSLLLIVFAISHIISLKKDQLRFTSAEMHSTQAVDDPFVETNIRTGETNYGNYALKYPQTASTSFNDKIESYVENLKIDFFQIHDRSSTLFTHYRFTKSKNLYSFVLTKKVKEGTVFTEKTAKTFLVDRTTNELVSGDTIITSPKKLMPIIAKRFAEQETVKQYNTKHQAALALRDLSSSYKNFTLSEKDITFYFNSESFTIPYNDSISVTISLNSIRNYVNKAYLPASPKKNKVQKLPQKVVALTFDDGPNKTSTKQILSILKKEKIKATFFILGSQAQKNPSMVKAIADAGHEIGNHSYTHPNLKQLSEEKIKSEISKTNAAIKAASGQYPTLFRPPYGSYDHRVTQIAKLPMFLWNVDTLDWKNHDPKKILATVKKEKSNNMIVLMHDIHLTSAEALPRVIQFLKAENYTFVTAGEMLQLQQK